MSQNENIVKNDSAKEKKNYGELQKEKREKLSAQAKEYAMGTVKTVEGYKNFLKVLSKFTRYSAQNIFLIAAQHPDATLLKSFDNWNKEGAIIRKGAKAVHIIAPVYYKGKDGKQHTTYQDDSRFDISDVDKAEVKEPIVYDQRKVIKALVHSAGIEVVVDENYSDENKNGAYYDPEKKKIYSQQGMAYEDMFTSVCKAVAHCQISNEEKTYRISEGEFYARSVAYTLANKYGVSTDLCNIASVPAEYQSMEPEQIYDDICRIVNCVKHIDGKMSEVLDRPRELKSRENDGKTEENNSKEKDDSSKPDKEEVR